MSGGDIFKTEYWLLGVYMYFLLRIFIFTLHALVSFCFAFVNLNISLEIFSAIIVQEPLLSRVQAAKITFWQLPLIPQNPSY